MEDLSFEEKQIIEEEFINLRELQKSYDFKSSGRNRDFLMKQIIDLNESISEANSDDLPQINEQLKRLSILVSQNDMIDDESIDLLNPYFAHMRLRDKKGIKNLYLGTKVYKVPGGLAQIIDWKTSPISLIYFLYEEGETYEEELEGRLFEGEVELKRILRVDQGDIIRIQQGDLVLFKD
ncbi:hypothetical protein KKA14_19840, partial [bacterium]|nr:hypothetical protein [bacterium]